MSTAVELGQISLTTEIGSLLCNSRPCDGVYFPPDSEHSLRSDHIIHTYLISPSHAKARLLSRRGTEIVLFDPGEEARQSLRRLRFVPHDGAELRRILDLLFSLLLDGDEEEASLDPRIEQTLAYLERLGEKRVTAGQLAARVALSESRFLHLFKEEMQVTLRKYLKWRRTLDGALMVAKGSSITAAAHATGFTDSSHFAKVFKQLFGLTLTTAVGGVPRPVIVVGEG